MTQNDIVLRHLQDFGSITAVEAAQEYGIWRLASRISELRNLGHSIVKKTEHSFNRYGDKVHYARYFLKGA